MDVSNGPPSLSPLDTKIIEWDIPKDGIFHNPNIGFTNWGQKSVFKSETHSHKWGKVQKIKPNES